MDKQARLALAEHVVYCRRSDKLNIPFVGSIMNLVSGAIFFTKGTLWHCQIW